jgi:hypothetical protein
MDDTQTNSVAIENLPEAMKPADDVGSLIGQRFGSLEVITFVGGERHRRTWQVRCMVCGRGRIVKERKLVRGDPTSCSCPPKRRRA